MYLVYQTFQSLSAQSSRYISGSCLPVLSLDKRSTLFSSIDQNCSLSYLKHYAQPHEQQPEGRHEGDGWKYLDVNYLSPNLNITDCHLTSWKAIVLKQFS